jgi:hypothetical protein
MTAPTPTEAEPASVAPTRDPGSFRDPGGFVYRRNGILYRQIDSPALDDWNAFLASGLAERLISEGRLIGHEVASLQDSATPSARAVIRPEPIPFVSYPYEWTFGELQDAALLTLDVQLESLRAGWTLRDATAYNVQFRGGRPILIDSLSFAPHEEGAPWIAYRQFCEHFLAPLALMARRDIRLGRLLRADPDGVPLDLASTLLPWRSRLNLGLLSHVHLHARAQNRYAAAEEAASTASRVRIDRQRLLGLVGNLRSTVAGLRWKPANTEWSDYADHTSYADAATASKAAIVGELLTTTGAHAVWDLGANTGRYSRIASEGGRSVLAFDIDAAAAERNYRQLRQEQRSDILPLVMDLANPSPGVGWAGGERRSLVDRANADALLALALIHHLAISRNVPLGMIVDLFAELAEWAVVEFVPKDDPMVRHLLATREDVFPDYTLAGFRAAAGSRFTIVAERPIEESPRVLFLLRRR